MFDNLEEIKNTVFSLLEQYDMNSVGGRMIGNEFICDVHWKSIGISSTEVRRMIKRDEITAPYVPSEVKLIIRKNNLYK